MRILSLIILLLTGAACDRLSNQINFVRLLCGSEPDSEFSLFRIQNAEGEFIDLSSVSFEVLREDLSPVPVDQYRATRSGCLQIKKQNKAFVRLPLNGESSATLVDRDLLNQQSLIQDKTPPVLSLPLARSNFRGGENLEVVVNEPSRLRYCVEASGENLCSLSGGPGRAFESASFKDFETSIRLPKAEGAYQLSVVAEDRSGLIGLLIQNFTVDATIPTVAIDFESFAETIIYDGYTQFYLDQGYRLGFRSQTDNLNQLIIEYCLLAGSRSENECADSEIEIYGQNNPKILPSGSWKLLYRVTDRAGNRAGDWDRVRILARKTCSEQELLTALESSESLPCTEVAGNLSLNRVALDKDAALDRLVAIAGELSLVESERQTVPLLRNLRSVKKVEIRDNFELLQLDMLPALIQVEDIDIADNDVLQTFSGFHSLKTAKNINLTSLGEVKDALAFDALEVIEGKLNVGSWEQIRDLSFLKSIREIDYLSLDDLENFDNLSTLQACVVKSTLELSRMPALLSLKGLEKVVSLKDLYLSTLAIQNMAGLESLQSVQNEFTIYNHDNLASLVGLTSLAEVGTLKFNSNESITTLSWTAPLIKAGTIDVSANPKLKSMNGWKALKDIEDLRVTDNPALTSMDFAPVLLTLRGSIRIEDNPLLKRIKGFGELGKTRGLDIVVKADIEPAKNSLASYTVSPGS